MGFQLITAPLGDPRGSDRDSALIVAADSEWIWDEVGAIFDDQKVQLASNIDELASTMRKLGWFSPLDARQQGITWRAVPDHNVDRSLAVRGSVREASAANSLE